MKAMSSLAWVGAALTALWPVSSVAWHDAGHEKLTATALRISRDAVPDFLFAGRDLVVHCSRDPDLFADKSMPELRSTETPEHYIDMEFLGGQPLPQTRHDFVAWCSAHRIEPGAVGFLPYAVTEWTERLALVLAEYRKWPADPNVRTKACVYAGILSHYAGDLSQPLHTTVDFDGRAGTNGVSPRSGIHARVDALMGKLGGDPDGLASGLAARTLADMREGVTSELARTQALVGRIYELEPRLPAAEAPIPDDAELKSFITERARAGAAFIASLYRTAWERSASVELPSWHGPAALTVAPGRPSR